jgi:hypothetical protein
MDCYTDTELVTDDIVSTTLVTIYRDLETERLQSVEKGAVNNYDTVE